jgi:hypothetical protein
MTFDDDMIRSSAPPPVLPPQTSKYSRAEILEIAKQQKPILWLIPASFVLLLIQPDSDLFLLCVIILTVLNVIFVWRFAKALKLAAPWLWTASMIVIPVMIRIIMQTSSVAGSIAAVWGGADADDNSSVAALLKIVPALGGAIVLAVLNSKALAALRSNGLAVSLMGARESELSKLVAPPQPTIPDAAEIASSSASPPQFQGGSSATHRKCPFCAEEILIEAIKCKHCHSMLVEQPSAPANPSNGNPSKAIPPPGRP